MLRTYTFINGTVVVGLIAALTPALAVLWAQPLQQQTLTPSGGKDTPPTEQAQGGLIVFTSQADFEAFNAREGNVLKGIEDFEESILGPNAFVLLDDPLESGVPNSPGGFPFPDGMTGLPNLIVQSNLGGGNPANENPRGSEGLGALSVGWVEVISDVVVTAIAPDSFDLIFTDRTRSVGFNTVTVLGGNTVTVRVYSTTNVFLGATGGLADPSGVNFIGVWSSEPIGRINIFDPGDGFESADNIQAWEDGGGEPCPWDLDGDGNVGATDLLALLVNWGPCP